MLRGPPHCRSGAPLSTAEWERIIFQLPNNKFYEEFYEVFPLGRVTFQREDGRWHFNEKEIELLEHSVLRSKRTSIFSFKARYRVINLITLNH